MPMNDRSDRRSPPNDRSDRSPPRFVALAFDYTVVMNEAMLDEIVRDLDKAGDGELSPALYTLGEKLKALKKMRHER